MTVNAAELSEIFLRVRAATEALAAPLGPEDQMLQSMALASPTKWHLGHTSWFFHRFVLAPQTDKHPAMPLEDADRLFNSYYEGVGTPLPRLHRALLSRPSADEVRAYRRRVDEQVTELLARDPSEALCALVLLGINHEEQHQELILTDIKHAFSLHPQRPAYRRAGRAPAIDARSPSVALSWRRFAGGLGFAGQGDDGFAFDNERPRHQVFLTDFALATRPTTCGEYLAFMRDGGYRRPELWLSDGWQLARAEHWQAPLYWQLQGNAGAPSGDGAYVELTLDGLRPIDLDAPVVHVSYYEADAFARWAGARLPGEVEWERAAGDARIIGNLLESGRLHPAPAGQARAGDLGQLFGDVWEWTASPYVAYPGYRPPSGALGEYNGKFMCNQLVLRGGSCATPVRHIRSTYRNFFPPDARWQFSGIRLAKDV